MLSMWLQLVGFISEDGSNKFLHEGDFSLDSIKVQLRQELMFRIFFVLLQDSFHMLLDFWFDFLRSCLVTEDTILQSLYLSLQQFSEKFLAGELTPFRKSQKAPEEVRQIYS